MLRVRKPASLLVRAAQLLLRRPRLVALLRLLACFDLLLEPLLPRLLELLGDLDGGYFSHFLFFERSELCDFFLFLLLGVDRMLIPRKEKVWLVRTNLSLCYARRETMLIYLPNGTVHDTAKASKFPHTV